MNDFNPAELSKTEFTSRSSEVAPNSEFSEESETTEDRCYRLIESLAAESKQKIRELANRRLKRFGLWDTTSNDLLQDAFLAILSGTQTGRGRHPRRQDLQNMATFTAYLKEVVNTIIKVQADKRIHQFVHESIDGTDSQIEAASWTTPTGLGDYARFTELRAVLFSRLKSRCPIHLRATLDRWEEICSSTGDIHFGRIHRRERVKFLELAKNVCNELGESLHEPNPNQQRAALVGTPSGRQQVLLIETETVNRTAASKHCPSC